MFIGTLEIPLEQQIANVRLGSVIAFVTGIAVLICGIGILGSSSAASDKKRACCLDIPAASPPYEEEEQEQWISASAEPNWTTAQRRRRRNALLLPPGLNSLETDEEAALATMGL